MIPNLFTCCLSWLVTKWVGRGRRKNKFMIRKQNIVKMRISYGITINMIAIDIKIGNGGGQFNGGGVCK